MSMFNDIDWTKKSKRWNLYFEFRNEVKECAKRFLKGHWTFLGPGDGMELFLTHLKENGILAPLKWWNDSQIQMHLLSYAHSEFLQNAPISTSVAFIDEDMNIHHINTFVFNASIENVETPAVLPRFFCRKWKIFVMY